MLEFFTQYTIYTTIGIVTIPIFACILGYIIYHRHKKRQLNQQLFHSTDIMMQKIAQLEMQYALIEKQENQAKTVLQAQQEIACLKNNMDNKSERTLNEDMENFLIVYKEKDKTINNKIRTIEEKNKTIYLLQHRLNEAQSELLKYKQLYHIDQDKDAIIQKHLAKIQQIQQELNETQHKFRKIALLHTTMTQQQQTQQTHIDEKNMQINALQKQLHETQQKLQQLADQQQQEHNDQLLEIKEQLQKHQDKYRILIVIVVIFMGLSLYGYRYIQTHYGQETTTIEQSTTNEYAI